MSDSTPVNPRNQKDTSFKKSKESQWLAQAYSFPKGLEFEPRTSFFWPNSDGALSVCWKIASSLQPLDQLSTLSTFLQQLQPLVFLLCPKGSNLIIFKILLEGKNTHFLLQSSRLCWPLELVALAHCTLGFDNKFCLRTGWETLIQPLPYMGCRRPACEVSRHPADTGHVFNGQKQESRVNLTIWLPYEAHERRGGGTGREKAERRRDYIRGRKNLV